VASLRLVTPGAATDLFFTEKLTTFLVIALCKVMTFFSCCLVTTPTFERRLSGVLSKLSHHFFYFIRVSPLDGVTRGGPPSDVTA